jgi:hypothetical protein
MQDYRALCRIINIIPDYTVLCRIIKYRIIQYYAGLSRKSQSWFLTKFGNRVRAYTFANFSFAAQFVCHKMFRLTLVCLSGARTVTSLGDAGRIVLHGPV